MSISRGPEFWDQPVGRQLVLVWLSTSFSVISYWHRRKRVLCSRDQT